MLLVVAASALGHDSWLVVDAGPARPGDQVRMAFVTAEVFPVPDRPTDPARVARWEVMGPVEQRTAVTAPRIDGAELVGRIALTEPGMYAAALALRPSFIELAADEFDAYLREEHASAALQARAALAAPASGREWYTKFAKTFVQVGEGGPSDAYARPVGHTLEIVPASNPLDWRQGQSVQVQVLLEGKPVAGVRVSAGHEGLPEHTYVASVVTDDTGKATIELTRPGLWFLRAHVIRPYRAGDKATSGESAAQEPKADWESFWASITFRVHGSE